MRLPQRSGVAWIVVSAAVAVLAACGQSGGGDDAGNGQQGQDSGNSGGQDSGTSQGNDAGNTGHDAGNVGQDAGTGNNDGGGWTEAPHLAPALEVYGGGRLLYAPKIVTVTFSSDTNASTYNQLGDEIGASDWWQQVTAGYCDTSGKCIGPATGGVHITIPGSPAASYTDSADTAEPDGGTIKALIANSVASGLFPAPDDETLYVIYFANLSTWITLSDQGQSATSCVAFGGYHHHVTLPAPGGGTVDAAYAIVMDCKLLGLQPTVGASHEILEATTDPILTSTAATGFYMDQTRDAWLAVSAAEVGDVCALLRDFGPNPTTPPTPDVYTWNAIPIQRIFSNPSVAAGHAMCVPTLSPVYFNTAPSVEKLVMTTGQSQTIELTGFSDGPTSNWTVSALDFTYLSTLQHVLTLTLDNTSANNGTVLHLTVDVTGTVSPTNGAPFVIVSTSSTGDVNFWPGIVETQ